MLLTLFPGCTLHPGDMCWNWKFVLLLPIPFPPLPPPLWWEHALLNFVLYGLYLEHCACPLLPEEHAFEWLHIRKVFLVIVVSLGSVSSIWKVFLVIVVSLGTVSSRLLWLSLWKGRWG